MVKETKDNPVSTDNYYKDLWTNPNTEAGQFFNKVDFNHKDYKDQEQVFRNFLKGLKRLKEVNVDQKPIETVLEVGAGTGRITKIVLEEFPDIKDYNIIEINSKFKNKRVNILKYDLVEVANTYTQYMEEKALVMGMKYDMVLGSEVLMHIKPEDIKNTVYYLSNLLAPNGLIVNIDWYHEPQTSDWCYIHNYEKMYRENGLFPVFMMDINKQKLFCYGK